MIFGDEITTLPGARKC